MNDSTHDDKDDKDVSEGTETLKDIADEVESEREERGRSEFDAPVKPDEQLMSDAAAMFEDNPDLDAETHGDHVAESEGPDGRAERGADAGLRFPPTGRGIS